MVKWRMIWMQTGCTKTSSTHTPSHGSKNIPIHTDVHMKTQQDRSETLPWRRRFLPPQDNNLTSVRRPQLIKSNTLRRSQVGARTSALYTKRA